ncbi:MAG: DUF4145 domain-containing protein [Verrucomicrobia bacterium]|nr:DUF4145 domain-containing protein [Verrucomicrobiota bacterium]
MSRVVQPSVRETAFSCPHCSALTTQYWHALYAAEVEGGDKLPLVLRDDHKRNVLANRELNEVDKQQMLKFFERVRPGLPLIEENEGKYGQRVHNLHISKCYNCKKIAVWQHERLLFPVTKGGVLPNADLPDDVAHDFEEAREIVNSSPRGAAALLRLCVQKLCKHLGEAGKNIDDDIASLVRKGLNPLVQQTLDIVRVVGNEAVHPGTLDLKDDTDTALRLFELVNAIAEQMISHPKVVSQMYAKLPESKRKAIQARDKK